MRILHVSGDNDYGALAFEKVYGTNKEGLTKAVKKAEENLGSFSEETDESQFDVKLHEFGEVDEKFIDFVRGVQDYDDSKHENFYEVL